LTDLFKINSLFNRLKVIFKFDIFLIENIKNFIKIKTTKGEKKMGKVFGAIGLTLGIIGLVVFLILSALIGIILSALIGNIFGVVAIIFGNIGISKDESRGLSIAGLVLGIICVVLGIATYILIRPLISMGY